MDDDDKRFTDWLNMMMQQRGFSQAELARAVGVGDAQVSRWRRGQVVPTVHSLQRIADAFGAPRANLYRLAGYPIAEVADREAADATDPARQAELETYQTWFGQLLERQVPRDLWRVYADACANLAGTMGASWQEALDRARRGLEERVPEPAEPDDEPPKPRDIGFRP